MANYSVLKAAVAAVVKTNGNQEITGANMQSTLISIINSLGTGYQFMGVATPSTSPGTPDYNVAYIGGAGTYANFGTSVTVPVGSIGVFKYNGSWVKEQIDLFAGIDDVPTANSNNLVKSGGVYQKLSNNLRYLTNPLNWVNNEYIANGVWYSGTYYSIIVPIYGAKQVKWITNGASYYTLLADYAPHSAGDAPQFATGYSDRVYGSSPVTLNTIPSDANYLYLFIETGLSDSNYYPSSVLVDEVEVLNSKWLAEVAWGAFHKIDDVYNAINNESINLKNVMHNDFILLDGAIDTTTGEVFAQTGRKHTAMLPLEDGYILYGASVTRFCCYSEPTFSQDAYLGSVSVKAQFISKDNVITGTKYVSYCFYNQTWENIVILSRKKISAFLGDTCFYLSSIFDQTDKTIFESELDAMKYAVKGFYLYGSGVNPSYKYYFRLIKYDGSEIRLYLQEDDGTNRTGILDKTISVPSDKIMDVIATQGNYNIRFIADFNRADTYLDTSPSFYGLNPRAFSPLQGNIRDIEEDVEVMKEMLDNISDEIEVYTNETEVVDFLSYFDSSKGAVIGGVVNYSSGAYSSNNQFTVTSYIPVSGFTSIRAKTPYLSNGGLAFYTGNNQAAYATEYISGNKYNTGGDGVTWIAVPPTAKYVRVTAANSDISGGTAVFDVKRHIPESLQSFVEQFYRPLEKRNTHVLYGYEGFCNTVKNGDKWVTNIPLAQSRNNLTLGTQDTEIRQIMSAYEMYVNKQKYEVSFEVNNAASFFSIGTEGLSILNELRVRNDNGSALFEIYSGNSAADTYETNAPRVVFSQSLSFSLVAGNIYKLGMKKFENETYDNVEHMDGVVYYIQSYTDNVLYEKFIPRDNIVLEGIRNGITAAEKGYQFVSLKYGDVTVDNIFVSSEYDPIAKAMIIGDSIVDGDTLINTDPVTHCGQKNKYACLLQSAIGMNSFVIAGKGGDGMFSSSMPYLQREVELFCPQYLIIAFGGNHNDFDVYKNNMEAFIAWMNIFGVTPILVTCPPKGTMTDERITLINSMNAWVRHSGYRYVDVSKAVTVDGAGIVWKSGLVNPDNTHPTPAGHQVIYEAYVKEIPELFAV